MAGPKESWAEGGALKDKLEKNNLVRKFKEFVRQ
jgi:hypothetical protein